MTEEERWNDCMYNIVADIGHELLIWNSEECRNRMNALDSYIYRLKSGYKPMTLKELNSHFNIT